MSTQLRLTIEEYDRMIRADVFHDDRRIELIRGGLREMNALGPSHESVTDMILEWSFETRPKDKVLIRSQNSIGLPSLESVPQPDVAWVVRRDYFAVRPSAKDVLLVIEVSDSSRTYDLGEKKDLYAQASIQEYWVVDIANRCFHIFRKPSRGEFRDVLMANADEIVSPLAFPNISLNVGSVFTLR